MKSDFNFDISKINSPETYIEFLKYLETATKKNIRVQFGGQVDGRLGVPICLVYTSETSQPHLLADFQELSDFCLHSGHGLEFINGQNLSVAIPFGIVLSHAAFQNYFIPPCPILPNQPIEPEDYVLKPPPGNLLVGATRQMLFRVFQHFLPNIQPRILYFEGRDPVEFQGLVFNAFIEDFEKPDMAAQFEGILRWFLPPSILVRLYKKNEELIEEFEQAPALVTPVQTEIPSTTLH